MDHDCTRWSGTIFIESDPDPDFLITKKWNISIENLNFYCNPKFRHIFLSLQKKNSGRSLQLPVETLFYSLRYLKGQCHEIFCFWFFSWISFPPAPEYPIRDRFEFFRKLRRYSQVKVHHRYQRHRWQISHRCQRHWWQNCRRYQRHRRQICHWYIWHRWQLMGTISGCWDLKLNLKAKIYL